MCGRPHLSLNTNIPITPMLLEIQSTKSCQAWSRTRLIPQSSVHCLHHSFVSCLIESLDLLIGRPASSVSPSVLAGPPIPRPNRDGPALRLDVWLSTILVLCWLCSFALISQCSWIRTLPSAALVWASSSLFRKLSFMTIMFALASSSVIAEDTLSTSARSDSWSERRWSAVESKGAKHDWAVKDDDVDVLTISMERTSVRVTSEASMIEFFCRRCLRAISWSSRRAFWSFKNGPSLFKGHVKRCSLRISRLPLKSQPYGAASHDNEASGHWLMWVWRCWYKTSELQCEQTAWRLLQDFSRWSSRSLSMISSRQSRHDNIVWVHHVFLASLRRAFNAHRFQGHLTSVYSQYWSTWAWIAPRATVSAHPSCGHFTMSPSKILSMSLGTATPIGRPVILFLQVGQFSECDNAWLMHSWQKTCSQSSLTGTTKALWHIAHRRLWSNSSMYSKLRRSTGFERLAGADEYGVGRIGDGVRLGGERDVLLRVGNSVVLKASMVGIVCWECSSEEWSLNRASRPSGLCGAASSSERLYSLWILCHQLLCDPGMTRKHACWQRQLSGG